MIIIALVIVGILYMYSSKKEDFQMYDRSMLDSMSNTTSSARLNRQPNPDAAPKEDCWIYYIAPKYHETCRLGYLDKTSGYLVTRRRELESMRNRSSSEQQELNMIRLAIEARTNRVPYSSTNSCKQGFADAKTQVKLNYSDSQTMNATNNDNPAGRPVTTTANWAYCWGPANNEDEARAYIDSVGTTGTVRATPDMIATFKDSTQSYYRINFTTLDYESVKKSMCAIKKRKITQTDTYIFVGFDIDVLQSGNRFKIKNYNVYVVNNNQLMTLAEYNKRANPYDVYTLMFEFKSRDGHIYIGPKSTTVSVGIIKMDQVCGLVEETPEMDLKTIDLGRQLGIQDVHIMQNPDNIDLSKGLEGLDEQYNQLAAEYIALKGNVPKRQGVEIRRYDLKPGTVRYGQANSLSTSGMDSVFRDNTQNMMIYYRRNPNMFDWQQNKAWEVVGYLYIETEGTYGFKLRSDDAGEFFVDDTLVSTHYWYHGVDRNSTERRINLTNVNLSKGFVSFKARYFQVGGPEGLFLEWMKPGDKSWTLIPDGVYFYEVNPVVRKMNSISQIRETMTRRFYRTVKTLMESIPNRTFVPLDQSDLVSSYISAYDRIYLSFGNPDAVLKPMVGTTQRQILHEGLIDICNFQKNITTPESIDFTQPAVYTISTWMRVENPCNAWRNVFIYGVNDRDRTPGLWLWPMWANWNNGDRTSLILHVRHAARLNNVSDPNAWNSGINVNLKNDYYRKWFHVAIVVNRDNMSVYIDGVKRGDSDTNGEFHSSGSQNNTITSIRGNVGTFVWNQTSAEKKFGLSTMVWRNVPVIVPAGPYYIQKLYWYNTPLNEVEINTLAKETIGSTSVSYVPSFVPSTLEELFANTSSSGEQMLKIGNEAFKVFVSVTSYNGTTKKWLLILNYLHKGGTNPNLFVRNIKDGFPLAGSYNLGDDGSKNMNTWGHLGNNFLKLLHDRCGPIRTMRFYAKGGNGVTSSTRCTYNPSQGVQGGNGKTIHFTTSDQKWIQYATTGAGNVAGGFQYTLLPEHNSTIPQNAGWVWNNQGDLALTSFPFWRWCQAHWGIRAAGHRWEVDDWSHGFEYHTHHQVWIGI
jgi:hypothetical protein